MRTFVKYDLASMPTLLGKEANMLLDEMLLEMKLYRWPQLVVGPPGCGKTLLCTIAACTYAREHGVNAYGCTNDQEAIRTGLIASYQFVDGLTVVEPAVIAVAMMEGAVCFIDELGHGQMSMQMSFNNIADPHAHTRVGGAVFEASKPTFRLLFATNDRRFAGNAALLPSCAGRPSSRHMGFPSLHMEANIAKHIVLNELRETGNRAERNRLTVPSGVIMYLTQYMRELRAKNELLGLSARNVAHAIGRLHLRNVTYIPGQWGDYFTTSDPDTVQGRVAARVLNKALHQVSRADFQLSLVDATISYISAVGVEAFREIIFQSFEYYLDVQGAATKFLYDEAI